MPPPEDAEIINIVDDTSHQSAADLMRANGLVDLLIPRGGAGLIRRCVENATVPCIQTGTGICHVYVDQYADLQKALDIIVNAKTSRPLRVQRRGGVSGASGGGGGSSCPC